MPGGPDRFYVHYYTQKNVPWHIPAPRAVACDNLHPRASAHLWRVSAFLCNRDFLGIPCYIKTAAGSAPAAAFIRFYKCALSSQPHLFYLLQFLPLSIESLELFLVRFWLLFSERFWLFLLWFFVLS